MAVNKHIIAVLGSTSSGSAYTDRVVAAQQINVPNLIGGGAGQAVTTTVTFPEHLPPNYQVLVGTKQDCTSYVTNRTVNGFDVVLTPRLAANTLAAGSFDVTVLAI